MRLAKSLVESVEAKRLDLVCCLHDGILTRGTDPEPTQTQSPLR